MNNIKPVIRWMGGKRTLAKTLFSHFPQDYRNYYEPFLGGGAIAASLPLGIKKTLSDANLDLMTFYRVLATSPDAIYDELMDRGLLQAEDSLTHYKQIQSWDRQPHWRSRYSDAAIATRFLYLNQTSFNGVWRVNSLGQHNVAYGRPFRIPAGFERFGRFLSHCEIRCCDYKVALDRPRKGDLVYLDPPYDLLPGRKFIGYSSQDFCQVELRDACIDLTERKVKFIQSNAATPKIVDLYEQFNVSFVEAKRCVAGNGDRRNAHEVIITNF